jgi:transposase-like protein
MKRKRTHYTAAEKMALLRRHLIDKDPVSTICDEATLQPTVFYRWLKQLLAHAAAVDTLDYPEPDEEAFFAAGKQVVEQSELLFAVWNGRPAAGLGGTADVVKHATDSGIPVVHINPITAVVRTLD